MTNIPLVFNRMDYFEGTQETTTTELAQWVKEADKIISF